MPCVLCLFSRLLDRCSFSIAGDVCGRFRVGNEFLFKIDLSLNPSILFTLSTSKSFFVKCSEQITACVKLTLSFLLHFRSQARDVVLFLGNR
jgi:hypothetical protein